jgi:2-phosphoglycerate kinase
MRPPLEWDRVKNLVHQIYIIENSTIEQTRRRLMDYGFKCSKTSFLAQMALWGFKKHQEIVDSPEVRETIRSLMLDHGFKDPDIQHVCCLLRAVYSIIHVRLICIIGSSSGRNLTHLEEYQNASPSHESLSENTKHRDRISQRESPVDS